MLFPVFVAAMASFGGLPFGTPEQAVSQKFPDAQEVTLAGGSRGLSRQERIADRDATRTWVIREGVVVEGVLLFAFKGSAHQCQQLLQTALSSIEANYGSVPLSRSSTSQHGIQSELWVATMSDGGRIEQRMVYAGIIGECAVSGRYYPPAAASSAF